MLGVPDDCLMCSPHALCNHSQSGGVECTCLPGYEGNGRECSLAEDTKIRVCLLGACWCPSGYKDLGQLCIREESQSTTSHISPSSSEPDNGKNTSVSLVFIILKHLLRWKPDSPSRILNRIGGPI